MEGRAELLARIGVRPTIVERLGAVIEEAISDAERRSLGAVSVLDAGCGHRSPLVPFRPRIHRLVGVDIHAPAAVPRYLDAFEPVDICGAPRAPTGAPFDLILSNFAVEHLADPAAAFANFRDWLRPDGRLVLTTVNRRHPFVAAYLDLPDPVRRRLQPVVKTSKAEAHALVGACNDPATVGATLADAGFTDIRVETVGNLGRAWRHRWPTLILGIAGDRLTQSMPSRRSTLIVTARRPDRSPG